MIPTILLLWEQSPKDLVNGLGNLETRGISGDYPYYNIIKIGPKYWEESLRFD